jgi:hypothetical protein
MLQVSASALQLSIDPLFSVHNLVLLNRLHVNLDRCAISWQTSSIGCRKSLANSVRCSIGGGLCTAHSIYDGVSVLLCLLVQASFLSPL